MTQSTSVVVRKNTKIYERVAKRDVPDLRDRTYEVSLCKVPDIVPLEDWIKHKVPVLDQGREGACTGFALATVAHYLLRTQWRERDTTLVSPYMLYALAKRYDAWVGENYSGSSCRGAIKAWYKHGVCAHKLWPAGHKGGLGVPQQTDAMNRPLGAYFRVNHQDLLAMQCAIHEAGVVYASASTHAGWDTVREDGVIHFDKKEEGGHAFVLVGYDRKGFWIQNSWDTDWGLKGFGHLSYEDWLTHGDDAWVVRLGVPMEARTPSTPHTRLVKRAQGEVMDTRAHVIGIGNNGLPRSFGKFANSPEEIGSLFEERIAMETKGWDRRRILLYAHGGLCDEDSPLSWLRAFHESLTTSEVYPVAFVWKNDLRTTIKHALADVGFPLKGSIWSELKDAYLDRQDDLIESAARACPARKVWEEIKENGIRATTGYQSEAGAAALAGKELKKLAERFANTEIHLAGHSAGSILLAPFVQYLATNGTIEAGPMRGNAGLGLKISSLSLWAPAITIDLFKETYLPLIQSGAIERFSLFTLTDKAERDDECEGLYHKSILYLVSNALEEKPRIPRSQSGTPLLGLEKDVQACPELLSLFAEGKHVWVKCPGGEGIFDLATASGASTHTAFDTDKATMESTLAMILGSRDQVRRQVG